ncbi:MAG: hypothetical protein LBC69_02320 [Eubacteriaceae bacterium]|nr:hypothetical protein [Eubacteriaceae bacterium]
MKLPKAGKAKIRQHRELPKGYFLKSVAVRKAPSCKNYAAIVYEHEADIKPIPLIEPKAAIGQSFP